MRLFEIESNTIDKELEQVAGNIGKSANARVSDAGGGLGEQPPMQGVDQQPNQPDPGLMSGPGEEDLEADRAKKVDAYVLSSVKSMPYVTDWRHRDNTATHPMTLAAMSMDELLQSRTVIRAEIQRRSLSDQFGTYADEYIRYLQDMISYVEKVIETKKAGMKKHPKSSEEKKAKFKTKDAPKNERAGRYKAKKRSS